MAPATRLKLLTVAAIAVAAAIGLAGPRGSQLGVADAATARDCQMDAIEYSICVYEAILADIDENYPLRGGGGISGIVQNTTTSFTARISQEGRVDLITYEIEPGPDGGVSITGRVEGVD